MRSPELRESVKVIASVPALSATEVGDAESDRVAASSSVTDSVVSSEVKPVAVAVTTTLALPSSSVLLIGVA